MRIGVDVSQTGRLKAGCGYVAECLIRHLTAIDAENDYVLYPTFGDLYWDPDWPASTCRVERANVRLGLGHRTYEAARAFWNRPPHDLEAQLGRPDVVHANSFYCPTGLKRARLVYTLYDLSFLPHPEWTTEENRIGCFTGVFNASLSADLIVAISAHSRRHFLETFPYYPEDRIIVVHPASRFAGPVEGRRSAALPALEPGRFWLTVGTLEPRKNQVRLLRAYASVKARLGATPPLVMAGGRGWLLNDLERIQEELGLRDDVILLGYVDDDCLRWLYQECLAFVYPSLFEGFGLPALEAMGLGAAVITSRTTSIPEIVGDAGLLIDPYDEAALAEAMVAVATQPGLRADLGRRAMRRAERFSWDAAARAVLATYGEVLRRRKLGDEQPMDRGTSR